MRLSFATGSSLAPIGKLALTGVGAILRCMMLTITIALMVVLTADVFLTLVQVFLRLVQESLSVLLRQALMMVFINFALIQVVAMGRLLVVGNAIAEQRGG